MSKSDAQPINDLDGAEVIRPLMGHEAAERLVLDAFTSGKMHHAWLLTGPQGVGKAALAWRIARFILSQGVGDDPGLFGEPLPPTSLDVDPESETVRRIQAGGHGDLIVLERDADAKTGKMRKEIIVDQVRVLTERFQQTTSEGGWRVAIIDSIDELNRNASNALLKVLEEPPVKTIMLLVSHSPGRLLPTIRSRCRVLPLKPLAQESLKAVIIDRFPDVPPEDLELAAALSQGAPGRGIGLLSGGGLTLYRETVDALNAVTSGKLTIAHKFADRVSGVKADADFRLMSQFLTDIMGRVIRIAGGAEVGNTGMIKPDPGEELAQRLGGQQPLEPWLDLWDKVAHRMNRLDAINMDRRQFVVSFFNDLSAMAQRR